MTNPLLDFSRLPTYPEIRPKHVAPAIDHLLAEGRALIARLASMAETATWENCIEPIDEQDNRLDLAWSPVSHLNAVLHSEAWRAVYQETLDKLSDYATEVSQNADLYRAYCRIAEQPGLNAAQRKLLADALRDFRLSGVDLPPPAKARYRAISQELARLASQFENNLLDATNAWFLPVAHARQLAGLPESALALARQQARERELDGWVLTLDMPSYLPVMMYAEDRALRQELYTAYCTRASDQGPHAGRWDNGPVMARILALRHERAGLLGFANYAELSLATKMAPDASAVLDFLEDLAARSVPRARQEFAELSDFARERDGLGTLETWDLAYYTEQLRQQRYAINQEELRPYFPLEHVLAGLFAIAARLFGIHVQPADAVVTWHPDARCYALHDNAGQLRAHWYLDPYARRNKRGGAWMDGCVDRFCIPARGQAQLPVAYLVCNFTPPVDGRPSLLTHDEVETLFHEFGHGLHHMLTRVDYPAVAGINGVPWDAVELPSQFLENWCWERESLGLFAAHYQTGEPLPEALYQRMRAARQFQAGMRLVRQLEFALFDLRLHREYDPAQGGRIDSILDQVREQVAVLKPPAFNRFAHGFSHIFAGGYGAGYYSYQWAEVLSADAFSLFEERGIFDAPTGQAFRERILEPGGSVDAMQLFVDFRGRPPSIEPLLRHRGITA